LGGNANVIFYLLSLGPKKMMKCYNRYFISGHGFHIEKYGQGRNT